MRDLGDLDNLMDNFDIHAFWQRRRLATILGVYVLHSFIMGIVVIKAVLDASDAGAVPKGMNVSASGTVVR